MWKYVCSVLGVSLATLGVIVGGGFFHPLSQSAEAQTVPSDGPNTDVSSSSETAPIPLSQGYYPAPASSVFVSRLQIPSIDLDDTIIPLGLNGRGEMDVPDGNTKNVGWYKDGPRPGEIGTAVLDAHVFAAFARLHEVKIGDSIYITQKNAAPLHFVVTNTEVYVLKDLTSAMLFGSDDTARLNLITCAGTFQQSINTYDHRLVVYTRLVQ